MPGIHRSALMPYSAQTMYDIVNDVDAYSSFLPWCGESKILRQGNDFMEASILMKKGPLNHWFSTRNQLIKNHQIDMTLIDGPFQKLEGSWAFTGLDANSSKIELQLEFEFSNKMASTLLTPIFAQIANTMVDSFCHRAHEVVQK